MAALCGAFVAFIAKLDVVAELSLGPVKAKMKEKIAEANATVAQLRKVATSTSEATLTDLMAGGFMDSMSLAKRLELHEKIISSLREIGANEEQISLAEKDWRKGISLIYYRIITKILREMMNSYQINPDIPAPNKEAYSEIEGLLDSDAWDAPTPHQIRSVLKRHSILDEEINSWINDYEHFLQNNEIRRREEFVTH